MDTLEAVRSFCILVTAVVLGILVLRFIRLHQAFPRTLQLFMAAMALFLITLGWDTVTLIQTDAEFSWRMLPLLTGLALCVAALAEPVDSVERRYGNLSRDEEIKSMRLERDELHNRLYETLRRENMTATKLLIVQSELDRSNEKRDATRPRDAV